MSTKANWKVFLVVLVGPRLTAIFLLVFYKQENDGKRFFRLGSGEKLKHKIFRSIFLKSNLTFLQPGFR